MPLVQKQSFVLISILSFNEISFILNKILHVMKTLTNVTANTDADAGREQ